MSSVASSTVPAAPICPSNDDVVCAVSVIRALTPELGRSKILTRLKEENNWSLSDARLKKLLTAASDAVDQTTLPPPSFPEDALGAQQLYKKKSIRCFKIYGRGQFDFGVTPNVDMAIRLKIAHDRLVKLGRADKFDHDSKLEIVRAWPMQCIWDYYQAAARIAGVPREDVGLQMEAEYGVNPIPYLPWPPTPAQVAARKATFKAAMMKLKRQMLKSEEARKYIPVDAHGEPIWDEAINGEFALIVVKIDKGDGLTEYGQV